MKVISIGAVHTDKFVKEISRFKKYDIDFISNVDSAGLKVPAFIEHEDAEKWAESNIDTIRAFLLSKNEKDLTFIVSQNLESGVILVVLQQCSELKINVDIVLIRRDFGLSFQEKTLSKVLFGVLYQFLNLGINKIYYFYFDMFRKIYDDISVIKDSSFYEKIALLWHKKNVFMHRNSFFDLTGEVKWGITQVNQIMQLPKLVILSTSTIQDTILTDLGLEIYRMAYFLSYQNEEIDASVEEYIKEVSHVVREFKFYNLGDDFLFELFVKPISGTF